MNRELWFSLLQIAVVAPYLYHLSRETKSGYFDIGLKLVAGAIIMNNIRPVLVHGAPVIKAIADATAHASQNGMFSDAEKQSAIDAEFTDLGTRNGNGK